MVGGIPGSFVSQLFSSILYSHRTIQLSDLQKGGMDKKLMFSCAPLKLQLITDVADNMVIYLCEPC